MEKGLQARFREHISEHFPQLKSGGGVFLLAFSGGADSTVLGELLFAEGVRFAAAHCTFHLRGAEVFAGFRSHGCHAQSDKGVDGRIIVFYDLKDKNR